MKAAGKRNKLVKIQQPGTTQDEIGQPIPGWVDVAQVWANIKHQVRFREHPGRQGHSSVVKVSIAVQKRAGVTAGMRVLYGSTAYQITAVLPDEESNDGMYLVCEVVNG